MSDEQKSTFTEDPASNRATTQRDDQLREDAGPLKQEGDALRDGSGSRQGQSPPVTGDVESR